MTIVVNPYELTASPLILAQCLFFSFFFLFFFLQDEIFTLV